LLAFGHSHNVDSEEHQHVTCGSTIKLENPASKSWLHSHQVTYGSGSGQQSVTGQDRQNDPNSLWIIRSKQSDQACLQGQSLKHDDIIRLQHASTKFYLHSHLHQSPLSKQQEVSCYGPESDTGDNWKIQTAGKGLWKRGEAIQLVHVDTSKYLSVSTHKFGNPIPGQAEIVAASKTARSDFHATHGFFFPPRKV